VQPALLAAQQTRVETAEHTRVAAVRHKSVEAVHTPAGLRSPEAARLVAVAQLGRLAVARSWGIHCKQGELRGRIAGKSR